MALERGADEFVVSTDPKSMNSQKGQIDLLMNTVSADHEVSHYLSLLHYNGTII